MHLSVCSGWKEGVCKLHIFLNYLSVETGHIFLSHQGLIVYGFMRRNEKYHHYII